MYASVCTIYLRAAQGSYSRQTAICHWEDTRGVIFGKSRAGSGITGAMSADSVMVVIPLEGAVLPVLSEHDKKQNYILRGAIKDDVSADTLAAFMQAHDVLTITAIEKNDYSLGAAGNNWVVYAK